MRKFLDKLARLLRLHRRTQLPAELTQPKPIEQVGTTQTFYVNLPIYRDSEGNLTQVEH